MSTSSTSSTSSLDSPVPRTAATRPAVAGSEQAPVRLGLAGVLITPRGDVVQLGLAPGPGRVVQALRDVVGTPAVAQVPVSADPVVDMWIAADAPGAEAAPVNVLATVLVRALQIRCRPFDDTTLQLEPYRGNAAFLSHSRDDEPTGLPDSLLWLWRTAAVLGRAGGTALAALAAGLGMDGPLQVHVLTYGSGDDRTVTGAFSSEAAAVAQIAADERAVNAGSAAASFPETPAIERLDLR